MITRADLLKLEKALKDSFPLMKDIVKEYKRLKNENKKIHNNVKKKIKKGIRRTDGVNL